MKKARKKCRQLDSEMIHIIQFSLSCFPYKKDDLLFENNLIEFLFHSSMISDLKWKKGGKIYSFKIAYIFYQRLRIVVLTGHHI